MLGSHQDPQSQCGCGFSCSARTHQERRYPLLLGCLAVLKIVSPMKPGSKSRSCSSKCRPWVQPHPAAPHC